MFAFFPQLTNQPLNSSGSEAITAGFFYAVVTVFPSNEDYSACYSEGRSATDHLVTSSSSDPPSESFHLPVAVGGGGAREEREKRITITVVPALTGERERKRERERERERVSEEEKM